MRRTNFRRRVWVPATEAAGVPGLRFHDLRHTGATLAAASGAPLKALTQRMGHTTVAAFVARNSGDEEAGPGDQGERWWG